MFGRQLCDAAVQSGDLAVQALEQRHQTGGGRRARFQQRRVVHGGSGLADGLDALFDTLGRATVVFEEEAPQGIGMGALQLLEGGPALEQIAA